MPITDVINARCYQSSYQSCIEHLPPFISHYARTNIDTLPKLLNHVLILMGICDTFIVLNGWRVSIIAWFTAMLLSSQTLFVFLILNHGKLQYSPRFLAPTDFMVGISLGISIGGTILSFFLSSTFRRAITDCSRMEDLMYTSSCERQMGSVRGVWWWSSLVMWCDIATCLLIAAGRRDFSFLEQHQYQTIGPSLDDYDDGGQTMKTHQFQGDTV